MLPLRCRVQPKRLVHDLHAPCLPRGPVGGKALGQQPDPAEHEHPGDVVEPDPADQRPGDLRDEPAPKPHISTARICVSTIAPNSGSAGNGGRKNQRSFLVMNSNKWPPATSCRNMTVCS